MRSGEEKDDVLSMLFVDALEQLSRYKLHNNGAAAQDVATY